MNKDTWNDHLSSGRMTALFSELYGDSWETLEYQRMRYQNLLHQFALSHPDQTEDISLFSTPGRTEVGGNHTDHNRGHVLAAAVSLDALAAAAKSVTGIITVYSEGYPNAIIVDTADLEAKPAERETSAALIRGIAAKFKEEGLLIGGFDAYISSDVLPGSGLSSSAAIEVLIGTILNALYNQGKASAETLAIIGQYAENHYFGKPCGLMDQMACAAGGFITIDFEDSSRPILEKIDFDFASQDCRLLVVDTGGSHADLTKDYADVPREMKEAAQALDKEACRDIDMDMLLAAIPDLRRRVGDRAILRAMHFLAEDQRVLDQVKALKENRFEDFLILITASGSSSWRWLQNCYTTQNPAEQGVTLALAVTEAFLTRKAAGACRVHGGGFAGTIQVFMPTALLSEYLDLIQPIFGAKAVTVLNVRPCGTLHLDSLFK